MLLVQEPTILDETSLLMAVTALLFSVEQWSLSANNCEQWIGCRQQLSTVCSTTLLEVVENNLQQISDNKSLIFARAQPENHMACKMFSNRTQVLNVNT